MSAPSIPNFYGFDAKVCVVTGAGSGIGRAIASAFAEHGARVVVLDRNLHGAQATVEVITGRGGQAIAIACDVADPASVAAAAGQSAAAFGPCDVLVNNAGVLRSGRLEDLSLDEWNGLLAINLTGAFICAQAFGRQMRAKRSDGDAKGRGGAMVHLASIAATHAAASSGAYSVGKAGIAMLSRQLAIEWGEYGIRSNAVNPGMTLTPMTREAYERPGTAERRNQAIPAGRIGRPEDIAEAVVFLASERSAYITGTEITVDGGFTRNLLNLVPRAAPERTGA